MRARRRALAAGAILACSRSLLRCARRAAGVEEPSQSASPPPATSSASPSPSSEPEAAPLTIYYVLLGDEGASGELLGCGDSIVAYETEPVATDDPLSASMERLLSDPARELESGLYSAIPGGTLAYVGGDVVDGTVTVQLTGSPAPAGECDNPRIETQLKRTAMAAVDAAGTRSCSSTAFPSRTSSA